MSLKKLIIVVVICLPAFYISCQSAPSRVTTFKTLETVQPPDKTEHILFGFPSTDCKVLFRLGYVLCHNDKTKTADWVSYHITDKYLIAEASRTDNFQPDPDLPKGKRAELSDYRGSGFDRGHLVPAGDMTRSLQAMNESFLLSNMSPQKPGFNRGIWKVLEEKVRELTKEKKNIYVIVGPLFPNQVSQTIGKNNVSVPSHFYKILLIGDKSNQSSFQAIAFIIPNDSFSPDYLNSFIVTIDKIEEVSGLDFLHELDDTIENNLESQNRLREWFVK